MNNFKAEEVKDNRSRNLRKKTKPSLQAGKKFLDLPKSVSHNSNEEAELEQIMTMSDGCLQRSNS